MNTFSIYRIISNSLKLDKCIINLNNIITNPFVNFAFSFLFNCNTFQSSIILNRISFYKKANLEI